MKIGKIKIGEKMLLEWAQFPLALIMGGEFNPETRELELIIKDDEMPEMQEGNYLIGFPLVFWEQVDGIGNTILTRQPLIF